ncbi:MAG: Na/Pi symporter, partial [Clostridia bacterium]|nr:Na/Pi symporter [Clostridia bacterium]
MFASILLLLGGLGTFLIGLKMMGDNLQNIAGDRLKLLFNKVSNNKFMGIATGAGITAVIQSSSATTVMIVGFVNAGMMTLKQATSIIMGANIGTTITAQIAALSAFPITTYIQGFVFVGVMMAMLCKNENWKKTGMIIAGLGLVFIGLAVMSDSMSGNKDAIQKIFAVVKNPFLLFFIGIFLTALVQSSSATTSIIIAMSVAGLTIGTGGNEVLYIILGTNIGSCVTALMSSLGGSANAKRTGLIHLMFNTFGSIIFFIILICWPSFMSLTFQKWFPSMATQIAMFHTFFNVLCTLMFLPFSKLFVKAAEFLVKDKKKEKETTYLDERMISSPMLAIAQVEKEMMRLSDRAMGAFRDAFQAFLTKDVSKISAIQKTVESMSGYNKEIINFIINVSANCNIAEEKRVSDLHTNLDDIFRIAEH